MPNVLTTDSPNSRDGLAYERTWVAGGTKTNMDVYLVSSSTATSQVIVVNGTESVTFTQNGTTYTSDQSRGETLTSTASQFTYTQRDGTLYIFDRTLIDPASYNTLAIDYVIPGTLLGVVKTITDPSGKKQTYDYKYQIDNSTPSFPVRYIRIQSIRNNFGYQAKFFYDPVAFRQLNEVKLINNAVDYCDPAADSCTFTRTWPKLSLTTATTFNPDFSMSRVDTTTDSLGNQRQYRFSWAGVDYRLAGVTLPGQTSELITYAYDANGLVSTVTRGGGVWTYSWAPNSLNMVGSVLSPANGVRTVTSNLVKGTVSTDKDELGRTTTYTYDTFGRVATAQAPMGNKVQYTYDSRGNVTEERLISKTPGSPPDIVKSATYPAICANVITCNAPATTTSERGFVTDYSYDPVHGGVTSITLPAASAGAPRPQTRFGFLPFQAVYKNGSGALSFSGLPVYLQTSVSECRTTASCAGTADESRIDFGYGPQTGTIANNLSLALKTASAGSGPIGPGAGYSSVAESYQYDVFGNLTTIDGPLAGTGDTITRRFDENRRLIGAIDPDPDGAGPRPAVAKRITYTADGEVAQSETGTVTNASDTAWNNFASQQQIMVTLDQQRRPVKQELKSGGITYKVTQNSYDSIGRLQCAAVRMDPGQWASQSDACVPQTTSANGPDRITKYTYNAANEVLNVQRAFGTTSAATEVSNIYNANGKLVTVTDAGNNRTTYEYDGFDRLVKTRYPLPTLGALASSTTDYEQLSYDASGNVISRRLRDGQVISFSYDNLDRVTFKDVPNVVVGEFDITASYDLQGRLVLVSNPSWLGISLTYDALGRKVTESTNGLTKYLGYDSGGRMTSVAYPGAVPLTINYDYDDAGNMTAVRENGATTGAGVLATYAYDGLGRRVSVTRGNGAVSSYAYDPVSRLEGLKHDVAGTSNDVLYGRVSGVGTPLVYNPVGQLTSYSRDNDSYAWQGHYNIDRSYGVNGLNQLTSAGATAIGYDARGNLSSSGSTTYSYTSENRLALTQPSGSAGTTVNYDLFGRLFQVTRGVSVTRFDYEGANLLLETDGASNIIRRYVYGPGTDEAIVWYEGAGTADRRWLHANEQGSIIGWSDGSGNMINKNTYDEYGIPGANNFGRFQYTGQAWISELGMYYYKARLFSPTLGRFMQTDPIGYDDDMNMYNYVGSDPVNKWDPSGLMGPDDANPIASDEILVTARRYLRDGGSPIDDFGLSRVLPLIINPISALFVTKFSVSFGAGKPQNGHWYRTKNRVCDIPLSSQQRAQLLSHGAIPGHEESVKENGTYLAAPYYGVPGGYVNTRFSADHNQVVNVTTWAHVFVGSVTRTIYSNSKGTFIETIGVGNAGKGMLGRLQDSANQEAGPQIFNDIDRYLEKTHAAKIPGC